MKPRERNQVTETTKNIAIQYQVERWEDEKGMETILFPK
jgi:hypothetical protein